MFETLHTVLLWAYVYNIAVTHYGNFLALNSIPWVFAASLMVQAVVTALVQVRTLTSCSSLLFLTILF
jgi:hypothetical protein